MSLEKGIQMQEQKEIIKRRSIGAFILWGAMGFGIGGAIGATTAVGPMVFIFPIMGAIGGAVCVVWVSALGGIGIEAVIVVSVSAPVGTSGAYLAQELNTRTEASRQAKTNQRIILFIFVLPSIILGPGPDNLKYSALRGHYQ